MWIGGSSGFGEDNWFTNVFNNWSNVQPLLLSPLLYQKDRRNMCCLCCPFKLRA